MSQKSSWIQSSKKLLGQYDLKVNGLIQGFPILPIWIRHKIAHKALHAKYKMGVIQTDEHDNVLITTN